MAGRFSHCVCRVTDSGMQHTTSTTLAYNMCKIHRSRVKGLRSVQRNMIGLFAVSSSSSCCCCSTKYGHSPPPAVAESVQSKGHNDYDTSSPCDRHIVHHLCNAGTTRSAAQAYVPITATATPCLPKLSAKSLRQTSQLLAAAATQSRQLVGPCRHKGLTGSKAFTSLILVCLAWLSCLTS